MFNVHVGIMLLEKQLLVNVGNTSARSAKRFKGAQEVSEATETWVEASRYSVWVSLYSINSVFSLTITIVAVIQTLQCINH